MMIYTHVDSELYFTQHLRLETTFEQSKRWIAKFHFVENLNLEKNMNKEQITDLKATLEKLVNHKTMCF